MDVGPTVPWSKFGAYSLSLFFRLCLRKQVEQNFIIAQQQRRGDRFGRLLDTLQKK